MKTLNGAWARGIASEDLVKQKRLIARDEISCVISVTSGREVHYEAKTHESKSNRSRFSFGG